MASPKSSPRPELITSKFQDQNGYYQEQFGDVAMTTTKYPYLESVRARFEQQRKEQEDRAKVLKTKREVEIAHSMYLKNNVVNADKMPEAKFVVDAWVKKHGKVGKTIKRLTKNKQFTSKKEYRTNKEVTPSYKNRISQTASKTESVNRCNVNVMDPNSVIVLSDDEDCYIISSRGDDIDGSSTPSCKENCNEPSSSGVAFQNKKINKNVTKDFIDGSKDHITCPVIGCDAIFSSREAKNRHDENFNHSPCNPLLLNINCALTIEDKYICPKCSKIFKSFEGCQRHMSVLGHLKFLSPLPFGGFICPQCLSIFNSHQDCWNHMVALKHKSTAFPFKDDLRNNKVVYPVPVSSQIVKEFCYICEAVPFMLKCVHCGIWINSPLQLTQHLTDTCNMHCVSVSATSTQKEVFSKFLSSHQCSECLSLCEKTDGNSDLKHKCSKSKSGHIVDLNCKSFLQFVNMCGIRCYGNSVAEVMSSEDKDKEEVDELLTCSQVLKKNDRKKNKILESKDNKERMSIRNPNILTLDTQKSPLVNESILQEAQPSRTLVCQKSPLVNESILQEAQRSRTLVCQKSPLVNESILQEAQRSRTLLCRKSPVVNESILQEAQPSRTLAGRKSPVVNQIIPEKVQNSRTGPSRTDPSRTGPSKTGPSRTDPSRTDPSRTGPLRTDPSRTDPSRTDSSRTDPSNLIKMNNIVFVDFDNWSNFFQKLTDFLPDKTFVWGFYGGGNDWKEPVRCPRFDYQKKNGRFHLHERCGQTKDAADFAICVTVGKLDVSLPKDVAFTILSGDKGFQEVERQLRNSERKTVVIDPHDAQKISPDMIHTMVSSVSKK